ncbi:MAG: TIGR02757 family protein [Sedimentisphaerales bacterium]|nr:TIGR02757 family protein [Sedimentisphaerales bacterium]
MTIGRPEILKDVLEKLHRRYNRRRLIAPDPLQFVYKYADTRDMEIAGFLAADLAYGRVGQIEKSVTQLLGLMGENPYCFVRNFNDAGRRRLRGFKHRFTTGEDISDLLELLRWVLCRHESIEGFFLAGYDPEEANIIGALSRFCGSLSEMYASEHNGRVSRGLMYLLASPDRGSACKRLNLFLRWMVRSDQVDAGLWKSVDKGKLVVPVDVHMGRLCRILRLYSRETASLAAALEITASFRRINPQDPVKYDFALSRIGIVEECTGRRHSRCEMCDLFGYCLERTDWKK